MAGMSHCASTSAVQNGQRLAAAGMLLSQSRVGAGSGVGLNHVISRLYSCYFLRTRYGAQEHLTLLHSALEQK